MMLTSLKMRSWEGSGSHGGSKIPPETSRGSLWSDSGVIFADFLHFLNDSCVLFGPKKLLKWRALGSQNVIRRASQKRLNYFVVLFLPLSLSLSFSRPLSLQVSLVVLIAFGAFRSALPLQVPESACFAG